RLELAPFGLVVTDKKVFQFLQTAFPQFLQGTHVGLVVPGFDHADKTVVPNGFSLVRLLRFDNSQQSNWHQATWKTRFVGQDQNIQRVAVVGARGGDKTKIVREGSAQR